MMEKKNNNKNKNIPRLCPLYIFVRRISSHILLYIYTRRITESPPGQFVVVWGLWNGYRINHTVKGGCIGWAYKLDTRRTKIWKM